MIKILVIGGSRRKDNYSQQVANFVAEQVNRYDDLEANLFLVADAPIDISNEGYQVKLDSLPSLVQQADALIVVSAEYNHSFPGSLKYVLDTVTAKQHRKPAAIVGVSSGSFGGVRAIEALSLVLRELGFLVIGTDLPFSNVKDEIINNKIKDPQKWQKRLDRLLTELSWTAKALQSARQKE